MVNSAAAVAIATSCCCLLHIHSSHGLSLLLPPTLTFQATIISRHGKQRRKGHRGHGGGGCSPTTTIQNSDRLSRYLSSSSDHDNDNEDICFYSDDAFVAMTRRSFFATTLMTTAAASTSFCMKIASARDDADDDDINTSRAKSTADATITDKIFIEFKGLSPPIITADGQSSDQNNNRIIIGLFGNDAPQPVSILKQLVSIEGYKDAKCKPLDTTRTLIKEQLEANKVYNTCMETEDTMGVNYDYATVWRVITNERIDVGAVSGRFVARENPNFVDGSSYSSSRSGLRHDAAGVVSVRRGNEGGFGFTIFPGVSGSISDNYAKISEAAATGATILDEENIVVGRILEGMDVVQRLNELPVVKQSAGSILGSGGGSSGKEKSKVAPSRGCRYGGTELYCNEYKPLRKVLLDKTGVM